MNINEAEAKKLGFESVDELLLCMDICGFESVPIADRDLLLKQCEDDKIGRTKKDFIEFMNEHNLIDLFNKVKYLSELERFIEIYNYFYNELEMSDCILGIYNRKVKEAKELFDGEKEEEYSKKAQKLFRQMERMIQRKNEIACNSFGRLNNDDQDKFMLYIEALEDHRLDRKHKGRKQ